MRLPRSFDKRSLHGRGDWPSAALFDPMRLVYTQVNSPALPE
jgi:hypothetical protein